MTRWQRIALVVALLAVLCALGAFPPATWGYSGTDEAMLAELAPRLEPRVADEAGGTRCPHVTYHLHADAALKRALPQYTAADTGDTLAAGMATDDTLPAWNDEPCTVWLKGGQVYASTLAHELLHTAGYDHGPAMDVAVRRVLGRLYEGSNRIEGRGSVTNRTVRWVASSSGIEYHARMKIKRPAQPKTRSKIARVAHMRNSAGLMGGTPRAQRRRDRQNAKRALRAGTEE